MAVETFSVIPHIAVCICTFKRPHLLPQLIHDVSTQNTGNLFTFSILIVDNDCERSAEAAVLASIPSSPVTVEYRVEPRQNIALARNMAVAETNGGYLAFLDDDELPVAGWLLTLFETCHKYDVDGVLGPVKPHYDDGTPKWVIDGKFYDRPSYPTGLVIDWKKGRTGNVLLRRKVFEGLEGPFRPEFRAGEDQDFFRRAIERGSSFIWCHEAMAYESVPATRWKRSVMLRRALLRGATAARHPGARGIGKSLIAVPAYITVLPLTFLLGHHCFMLLLVKLCDHLGKLMALVGVNPIKEQYVTE